MYDKYDEFDDLRLFAELKISFNNQKKLYYIGNLGDR